jgi:hypothetical protein
MILQAVIELWVVGPPRGERPRLGVMPADHFGTSPEEHDRIAREAGRASLLVGQASLAQAQLLQRLANAATGGRVRVPFVATLERFLAVTSSLDIAAAAALSDEEIAALWRDEDREAQ